MVAAAAPWEAIAIDVREVAGEEHNDVVRQASSALVVVESVAAVVVVATLIWLSNRS